MAAAQSADAGAAPMRLGRVLGALLLLHLIGGLVIPYVLLGTALAPPGVVAANAASQAAAVRTAVALFVAAAALVLAIAVVAWPLFRRRGERLAVAFLGLAVANLPMQLVEGGTLLTMLSLSQQLGASVSDATLLQAAGTAAAFGRRWAHFTHLLTVVSWLFVLYLTLWRTALVPRPIAWAGMATALMQIAGVPIRVFLGYPPIMAMAVPLAPAHITLALWLMVKGFPTTPVTRAS